MEDEQIIHANESIAVGAGKAVLEINDREVDKALEKVNQILKKLKEAEQIIKSLSGEKTVHIKEFEKSRISITV